MDECEEVAWSLLPESRKKAIPASFDEVREYVRSRLYGETHQVVDNVSEVLVELLKPRMDEMDEA